MVVDTKNTWLLVVIYIAGNAVWWVKGAPWPLELKGGISAAKRKYVKNNKMKENDEVKKIGMRG